MSNTYLSDNVKMFAHYLIIKLNNLLHANKKKYKIKPNSDLNIKFTQKIKINTTLKKKNANFTINYIKIINYVNYNNLTKEKNKIARDEL